MRYVIDVQEDEDGSQFIQLPPELLEAAGWKEGDTLAWTDNNNGSWTLTKKE